MTDHKRALGHEYLPPIDARGEQMLQRHVDLLQWEQGRFQIFHLGVDEQASLAPVAAVVTIAIRIAVALAVECAHR